MGSDKIINSRFSNSDKNALKSYFYRKKNIFLVVFTLFFLMIFPFLIYETVSETMGIIGLSRIERNLDKSTPSSSLNAISNYYHNSLAQYKIIEIQLQALEKIPNPSIEIQIQKIRIVKMIIEDSWFPDPTLYQRLAKIFHNMQYYQEAIYYLDKYIAQSGEISSQDWIETYTILYDISMLTGNYTKGIASAKKVLAILPDDPTWTFHLARSYIADQQYNLARIELEKLVYTSLNPDQHFKVFFSLLDILTHLELQSKIDFFLHYLSAIYSDPEKKSLFLSEYAKYLTSSTQDQEDLELSLKKWQASYHIFAPIDKGRDQDIKNSFDEYLKS